MKSVLVGNQRHPSTVMKGFEHIICMDERLSIWCEVRGPSVLFFRRSGCTPTLYCSVYLFFTDLTCHCSQILNFHIILGPSLALCSVPQISLPFALQAHTVLLWGRAVSFRHMCCSSSRPTIQNGVRHNVSILSVILAKLFSQVLVAFYIPTSNI